MKFKKMQKRGLLVFFMIAPWAVGGIINNTEGTLFLIGLALFFLLLPFILNDDALERPVALTTKEILGYLLYISGWILIVWNAFNGTFDPNSSVSLLYITPIVIGFFLAYS